MFICNSTEQLNLALQKVRESSCSSDHSVVVVKDTIVTKRDKYQLEQFQTLLTLCPAVAKLFEEGKKKALGHDEGLALVWIFQDFDGWQTLIPNMVGWGKTEKDWTELNHSAEKNYVCSCLRLQELGYCPTGKSC